MGERLARLAIKTSRIIAAACSAMALAAQTAGAQEIRITKTDSQIDALDAGIRLFVREKMPEGNTRFTNENMFSSCMVRPPRLPAISTSVTRIIRGPIGW